VRVAALVGPTAAGKTAVAIDLCTRWGGEIVGVDASQVYRHLDIGTGKARPKALGGVRHHLIDVVAPDAPFDAGRYLALADEALADIHRRGRRPLLCGGTGLYLRAVLEGLCPAPPVAPEVSARLRSRLAAGEGPRVHAELMEVDPEAAARIGINDAQRLERALGVWHTTGRPLSDWQRSHGFGDARHTVRVAGIRWPRAQLVSRIDQRVDAMFAAGWVDEVRDLVTAGHGPWLQSMGALGYRYIAAFLAGETSLDEARGRTKVATRRYAKRQMTWFRRMSDVRWFDGPVDIEAVAAYFADFWRDGE